MALLQYRAPVDYEAQQEAFRDFLESFKSSESATEETAADAIDGLHIDGDGTSDEYDFMDDAENGDGTRSRRDERSRPDKRKYVALLQDIADRVKSNILIELDDLELVRAFLRPLRERYTDNFPAISMNEHWVTSIT
jgi:DNA replication licensing factor MCM7